MHKRLLIGVISIAALPLMGNLFVTRNNKPVCAVTDTIPYQLVYPTSFGNRINATAGNPLTKEGVALGRLLFYERLLSANNRISCASCHKQKFAFADNKAFSDGIDTVETTRNSMSLTNLLWVRNFFWDGRAHSLEEQAAIPLSHPHEMGQSPDKGAGKLQYTSNYPALFLAAFGTDSITGGLVVKALAQFERTLISANSRYDQYLNGSYQPSTAEAKGMALFMNNPSPERNIRGAGCGHCHGGPKLYLELFHNNGLDSLPKDAGIEQLTGLATDRGRFRVPTLRNIAVTAPYMHDGRFATLEEVLDHYSDHIQESPSLSAVLRNSSNEAGGKTLHLTGEEKKDIIAFLQLLTDSSFLTNPAFTDPHTKHN